MPYTITELVAEYEAHFTSLPANLEAPRTAERWTKFAAECNFPLERIMTKAAELRGASRARPTLGDLELALKAIQNNEGIRAHAMRPCGLCVQGMLQVTFWTDENGKAVLGHSGNTARLYTCCVPCSCSWGQMIAQDEGAGPEDLARWMDAHMALKRDAKEMRDANGNPMSVHVFIDNLVRESVRQFGPKMGQPRTKRMIANAREARFADA